MSAIDAVQFVWIAILTYGALHHEARFIAHVTCDKCGEKPE